MTAPVSLQFINLIHHCNPVTVNCVSPPAIATPSPGRLQPAQHIPYDSHRNRSQPVRQAWMLSTRKPPAQTQPITPQRRVLQGWDELARRLTMRTGWRAARAALGMRRGWSGLPRAAVWIFIGMCCEWWMMGEGVIACWKEKSGSAPCNQSHRSTYLCGARTCVVR